MHFDIVDTMGISYYLAKSMVPSTPKPKLWQHGSTASWSQLNWTWHPRFWGEKILQKNNDTMYVGTCGWNVQSLVEMQNGKPGETFETGTESLALFVETQQRSSCFFPRVSCSTHQNSVWVFWAETGTLHSWRLGWCSRHLNNDSGDIIDSRDFKAWNLEYLLLPFSKGTPQSLWLNYCKWKVTTLETRLLSSRINFPQ